MIGEFIPVLTKLAMGKGRLWAFSHSIFKCMAEGVGVFLRVSCEKLVEMSQNRRQVLKGVSEVRWDQVTAEHNWLPQQLQERGGANKAGGRMPQEGPDTLPHLVFFFFLSALIFVHSVRE